MWFGRRQWPRGNGMRRRWWCHFMVLQMRVTRLHLFEKIRNVQVVHHFTRETFRSSQLFHHRLVGHHFHEIWSIVVFVLHLWVVHDLVSFIKHTWLLSYHRHPVALYKIQKIILLIGISGPHFSHSRDHVASWWAAENNHNWRSE